MSETTRFPELVSSKHSTPIAMTPNRSTTLDVHNASSPTPTLSAADAELLSLKQKLRDQTQRLSASPHRLTDGAQTSRPSKSRSNVLGSQYATKPYQRIVGKQMWEPSFNTDDDVKQLAQQLQRSEERIAERKRQMEVQWAHGRPMIAPSGVDSNKGAASAGFSPRPPSGGGVRVTPVKPAAPAAPSSRPPSAPFAPTSLPQLKDQDEDIPAVSVSTPEAPSISKKHIVTVRDSGEASQSHEALSVSEISNLRRRTSSVKVSQGTIAMLRMLQGRPDIVLPCPKETGFERNGDVLTSRHILKQDLFEAAFNRRDQLGVMSGAPYFRMVPKFHIGGVAQAHMHGIRTALNELRKAQSYGPILWVNLREEPLVYLNQRSHIIRSAMMPTKPAIIPNISGTRITRMEEKLKTEILTEAQKNGGNVCVHRESANGAIDEQWEAVESDSLLTVEEIFRHLNDQGMNIIYQRRPVTQGLGPQASDFQFVIDLCEQHPEAPMIFNCQTGRGRSSLMMLMASIVRFYQMCTQDIDADVTLLRGDGKANNFRTLQKLISLLPDGALHERRVAILMELSDKIYSIADHINAALRSGEANEKSKMRLSQYAYLLMFSCYCEQYFWLESTVDSFPQWIDNFPEVKVLVNSIHASHHATDNERIQTPQHVESNDIVQWVRNRRGHVLCANTALCSVAKEISAAPATTVAGVLALRQLAPDVPVFTCGRVSAEGREELLYNVRLSFPKAERIIWVSLRSEPMVFINGTGYSLVDYSALHNDITESSSMHISKERLEEIEERLVKDVLQEAQLNNGEILLHHSKEDGVVEAMRVQVAKALTPSSVMDGFKEDNSGVTYVRVPMPSEGTILPVDIDPLIAFLEQSYTNDDVIILNDTDGAMRTTIAMNIVTLVRASRTKRLREIKEVDDLQSVLRAGAEATGAVLSAAKSYVGLEEEETVPTEHHELQVASVICQMLAAGSMLKAVALIIRIGGIGTKWNILHAIDLAKGALQPNDKTSAQAVFAVDCVRKYLLVLLSAVYIEERSSAHSSPTRKTETSGARTVKLSEWIASLLEVSNIMQKLNEKPLRTLKYIVSENLMANTVNRAVDRRSGDVLTANYMMKADHFPGCQKKGLRPQVCGAPNFRKVEGVNIFGVAIPTITGVFNVLTTLGANDAPMVAHPNDPNDEEMFLGWATPGVFDPQFNVQDLEAPLRGRVVWVNLREEPIIYVGDRPFVFRDMSAPYVNVELTGIEASKVEMVEDTLKSDILTEAHQYDGNFLVHDEGKPGELVGIWEPATTDSVRTVRQLYQECAASGCRVTFIRMPVTDEQSPEMKDFDHLVDSLLPLLIEHRANPHETLSFVFNCQMGRGRTTTGMVVCCLLLGIINPDYYAFLDQRYPTLWSNDDSELMKGNYQCVSQLRSVLSDGRSAKHRIDLVLEACSKMQNLRTAIESFATQVTSPDVTEETRGRALHHGVHYLQRYFNLIAFSSYLQEEFDSSSYTLRKTFAAWMDERPEIVSLHDAAALQ